MKVKPGSTRDMQNLDLLRSLAVLLVFADHLCMCLHIEHFHGWDLPSMGIAGVFMFFVHTSLVLMWSLERKPHTLDFYIRRVFRIYPLAVTALTVALITHLPVSQGAPPDFAFVYTRTTLAQKILHYILLQNLHHGNTIVGVMWTLPLEMQMYIFLPILFFFVLRNCSLWPLLTIWMLVVFTCLAVFQPLQTNLVSVAPLFIPGIMAFVGFQRRRAVLPGAVFPLYLLLLFAGYMAHPRLWTGWLLCLALGLGLPYFRQIRIRGVVETTRRVAKYSYGIYLSHVFVMVILFAYVPHLSNLARVIVSVVATYAIASALYRWIEHPMIQLGAAIAAKAERYYEQKHPEAECSLANVG